jgi:hypothetical protein
MTDNPPLVEPEFGMVWLMGCRCGRCQHEWLPRTPDEKPKACAKCKSPYWNKERKLGGKFGLGSTAQAKYRRRVLSRRAMNRRKLSKHSSFRKKPVSGPETAPPST